MAKASPTQRTLKHYRSEGWTCQVAERWIPQARKRQDLFGFIDIVGLDGDRIIGIQSTSYSNHSARRKKILECEAARLWYISGGQIVISSWKKKKNGRYEHREEYVHFIS